MERTLNFFTKERAEKERLVWVFRGYQCSEVFWLHGMYHFTAKKLTEELK